MRMAIAPAASPTMDYTKREYIEARIVDGILEIPERYGILPKHYYALVQNVTTQPRNLSILSEAEYKKVHNILSYGGRTNLEEISYTLMRLVRKNGNIRFEVVPKSALDYIGIVEDSKVILKKVQKHFKMFNPADLNGLEELANSGVATSQNSNPPAQSYQHSQDS